MSFTSVSSEPGIVPARWVDRANACRILADCFWEPRLPDAEAWDMLTKAAGQWGGQAVNQIAQARQAGNAMSPDQLRQVYAQLFMGPFAIVAAPYASVYLDQEEAQSGRCQSRLLAWYARAGLYLPPRAGETPDHLSVELEFVYFLLVQALQRQDAAQWGLASQFVVQELQPWLLQFVAELQKTPLASVYRHLGEFALQMALGWDAQN